MLKEGIKFVLKRPVSITQQVQKDAQMEDFVVFETSCYKVTVLQSSFSLFETFDQMLGRHILV